MSQTEKTVITIETIQRTTIRSRQGARTGRSERCAANAPSHAAHQHPVHEIPQIEKADEDNGPETERVIIVRLNS